MKKQNNNIANTLTLNAALRSGEDKVGDMHWSYEAQCWLSKYAHAAAEGLCVGYEDFTSEYTYYETALKQITDAIRQVGVAVITDGPQYDWGLAPILKELGYKMIPFVNYDYDGMPIEWVEVFQDWEAENEFLRNSDHSHINLTVLDDSMRKHIYEVEACNSNFRYLGVVLDCIGDLVYGYKDNQSVLKDYFPDEDDNSWEARFCADVAWRELKVYQKNHPHPVVHTADEPLTTPPEPELDPKDVTEEPVMEETHDMTDFELDLKAVVALMATNGFDMVMDPTETNLPFVGYYTQDDREDGGEITIECRLFGSKNAEGAFISADSEMAELDAGNFLGWKSLGV